MAITEKRSLMGSFVKGILSPFRPGRGNAFLLKDCPWYCAAALGLGFVIVVATPPSMLIALIWRAIEVFVVMGPIQDPSAFGPPSWPVALSWPYGGLVGPYLLWLPAVAAFHKVLLRHRTLPGEGVFWRAAASLSLSYVAAWCIPASWPYLMIGIDNYLLTGLTGRFGLPLLRVIYYGLLWGVMGSSFLIGVLLFAAGMRKNLRILRAEGSELQ